MDAKVRLGMSKDAKVRLGMSKDSKLGLGMTMDAKVRRGMSMNVKVRLQSWTKVLTHLSKTNAFYPRPCVNSNNIFFTYSLTPSPPFQC